MSADPSIFKIPGATPYEKLVRQDQLAREQQIAIEGMNLVRERLAICFRTEGVNHFVKCKELREQYAALCSDRFKGMVFPSGVEPINRRERGTILVVPAEK